jgi:hypothetical protein
MRISRKILKALFNRETVWALLLVLMIFAIFIMTSDNSPTWIYQGF